jgi:2-keto-4-pentenoate hydratase/2-oxohepta-3-ene-1,7-dioic acid hydratase in catechol pathway
VRFATVRHEGVERVGVVGDGDVALLAPGPDLVDLVAGGAEALADARRSAARAREVVALDDGALLAPLRRFRRDVLCTGWNYWDHFEEGRGRRDGQEVPRPDHPTFFTKGPDTVIGPYDDIAFDARLSVKWDYEAELALVIGLQGRDIRARRASEHVWGYLLANDVSQRDLQRAHGGQWLKGKSIDATMPIGPWVVTADEVDPAGVRLQCWLNGTLMQDASTASMAFPIPELLAELSWGMTLRPGDLVLTGTPAGVGNARDPQVFLAEGDEVVVRGSGIGELRNRVASS